MSTCPDSTLYSALADGEVPSPWKEKLEDHVQSCPSCQKRVERYRRLRGLLRDGAPSMSESDLETSYLTLMARREAALSANKAETETGGRTLKFPAWARASVSLPIPAIAALVAFAVFVPSWFAFHTPGKSAHEAEYAAIIPAVRQAGESGLRAISTSNPVYSPDLPPETLQASMIDPRNRQYFTMVEFARQFAGDKDLFSDAGGIVIIKLPSLTRFDALEFPEERMAESDDILRHAAGFYR